MKINMHTSHPSAFISSTFLDLKSDRAKVASVLDDRGLNVNALDIQPASSQTSKEAILTGIRESDFIILIIGDRYGSILPSMTGSAELSITAWEYRNAIKLGKPVIAFFKSGISSDPAFHDDKNDKEYAKKRNLFEKFKNNVSNRHTPTYYSSLGELGDMLDKSLIRTYRSGLKNLTSKNSELSSKVKSLESEIDNLKKKIDGTELSELFTSAAEANKNNMGSSNLCGLNGAMNLSRWKGSR